jgi:hypothetical protein
LGTPFVAAIQFRQLKNANPFLKPGLTCPLLLALARIIQKLTHCTLFIALAFLPLPTMPSIFKRLPSQSQLRSTVIDLLKSAIYPSFSQIGKWAFPFLKQVF